jgi:hypothetical protein
MGAAFWWAALEFSKRSPLEAICTCQRKKWPFVNTAWPTLQLFVFTFRSYREGSNTVKRKTLFGLLALSMLGLEYASCAEDHNSLSDVEKTAGWRLLFDGRSTAGWRGYRSNGVPESWKVENGSLLSRREKGVSAGDLITIDEFDNFELRLEWKMTRGGNSGVIYRATEQHDQVWQSGPEYQILDNTGHLDGLNTLASAGACYAVFAPAKDMTRTLGQWNETRILAQGTHVEHWLNGAKLLEYDIDSDRWQAHVKTSKFFLTAYGQGNWGRAKKGHIGLQDYGGAIEYRNIKIRPLPATGE